MSLGRWSRRWLRRSAGRSPSPRIASARSPRRGAQPEAGRRLAAGKSALPQGEEEKNDNAFIDKLSVLGDIYVNDAFSTAHRAHASTEGLAHLLPAAAGRLMQAELQALDKALGNPKRPVCALVGA